MRWQVLKKAWRVAKEAFPNKDVWVMVPFRMMASGAMEVYDLSGGKLLGRISYKTTSKSGRTIVSMSVNNSSSEVVVPYVRPRSFRIHAKAPDVKMVIGVPDVNTTEAAKPKFRLNERVRVEDGSMDHGELGTIMEVVDSDDGHGYLVLVDGSSEPIQIAENDLRKNMAGAVPK